MLNYLGDRMLAHFRRAGGNALESLHLVNDNGFWLSGPSTDHDWGFMLPHGHSFAATHPEAWVRIDAPQSWGGIVGALQDNGSLERGWLLGFRDNRFCLAIHAVGGPDRLTYLTADTPFTPGAWYHVMGTYDGRRQCLYVNGQVAAFEESQRGDIRYPDKTFYEIGAYHDSDEYFRTKGMIHEVCVYDRALSASEARDHYERAVRMGRKADDPALAAYQGHLEAIKEKLAASK